MQSISDWQPFTHKISQTDLDFRIFDEHFEVTSNLAVERENPSENQPLFLNGTNIELINVWVDDTELTNNEYTLNDEGLTIHSLPESASVKIEQKIQFNPNAVDGLYRSDSTLVTQCEDEAFRKIAFFPDRPDVMSQFKVRVEANQSEYPILLSNGNEISRESCDEGRHAVTYEDPFLKPCYLFALVAGDLVELRATYMTLEEEPRNIELAIYSDADSIRHCVFAMDALKRSMRWDEEEYDRVYDLDRFSIVAVKKFLFGAMENKSLNVFNTQALHASPDVALDANYERIESIVAHEYFHNYSGNRVTVRDWFQLSLKEGFTVFRDQSYTRFRIGDSLGRIIDADHLRTDQFPEAKSSLAHPVRPEEMEVPANYYTRTIYEGGAEVIYMLRNLLGAREWRKATNHYFETFDHQAVTIDHFVQAIEESSGRDLSQFKLWYSVSGVPHVSIKERRSENEIVLTIEQETPPTADQAEKPVLEIPLSIGLIDGQSGTDLLAADLQQNDARVKVETELEYTDPEGTGSLVFLLNQPSAEIKFTSAEPTHIVSAHRDFSAPVEVTYVDESTGEADLERLYTLVEFDPNYFVRWDSMQRLFVAAVMDWKNSDLYLKSSIGEILEVLTDSDLSAELRRINALLLTPPTEGQILDLNPGTPIEDILNGLKQLKAGVMDAFGSSIRESADRYQVDGDYDPDSEQASYRYLRHALFGYLTAAEVDSDNSASAEELATLIREANNLTDRRAYFRYLLQLDDQQLTQDEISTWLYERFKHEPLFVEKWLMDLISVPEKNIEDQIQRFEEMGLLQDLTPNRWRAVFGAYTTNWHCFHRANGEGYDYYTDRLLKDASNMGGIVAKGVQPLAYYYRCDASRAEKLKACLRRLDEELPESHVTARDMVTRALRQA